MSELDSANIRDEENGASKDEPSSGGAGNFAQTALQKHICLLPGDGIGPEIVAEALKVLEPLAARYNVDFVCHGELIGGIAIDEAGDPLPQETIQTALACDAVLLGAVGGPKWDSTDPDAKRPEQGLLGIRKALGLFANLRPVYVFPALAAASPLHRELVQDVDLMLVRELMGGLYFGAKGREISVEGAGVGGGPGRAAFDALDYSEFEIDRIIRVAFNLAQTRRAHVTSVDKANVLETSRLWREIVHEVAAEYPSVELQDMLVDNAAMQLVRRPAQFDVIVTENMFGDILSDEAAMISGSLGMMASASIGFETSLFEPAHGSAPDIADQGIANPLAQILSVALMLEYGLGMPQAAADVRQAVNAVLEEGWRTADIADANTPDAKRVGTADMGDLVAQHV